MPISSAYPYTLTNGTTADATQVMADFLQIQNDVNSNAAPLGGPAFTGIPTAPTAAPGTNTTQLATTAFVTAAIAALTSTFAPLASPTFTGSPAAPTPTPGDNSTLIATTAFVTAAITASLVSPAFSGNPTAPTQTAGNNSTRLATTAFVTAAIPAFAAKSDMQAASSTTLVVNPAQTQNHPGVAKAWCVFTGSTGAILASYNIASITRNSTGDWSATFTTNMASGNYVVLPAGGGGASTNFCLSIKAGTSPSGSGFEFVATNVTASPSQLDPVIVAFAVYGSQ